MIPSLTRKETIICTNVNNVDSSNEQDSTHQLAKLVAYLPIGHQDTHQSHGCNDMVLIPAIQHSSPSTGTPIQP